MPTFRCLFLPHFYPRQLIYEEEEEEEREKFAVLSDSNHSEPSSSLYCRISSGICGA